MQLSLCENMQYEFMNGQEYHLQESEYQSQRSEMLRNTNQWSGMVRIPITMARKRIPVAMVRTARIPVAIVRNGQEFWGSRFSLPPEPVG